MRRALALLAAGTLLLAACGSDDDDTDEAEPMTVEEARAEFCEDTEQYLGVLDQYGGLFSDSETTVGQLSNAQEELTDARSLVESAVADLEEAIAAAEEEAAEEEESEEEESGDGEDAEEADEEFRLVSDETIERVESAEQAFEDTIAGITDATPVTTAGIEFTSAAYALQVAWAQVFVEAECTDQSEVEAQVTEYVKAIQTDLTEAGYYSGAIDGIYGPETVEAVKALQRDAGLPETGLVDKATAEALARQIERQETTQIAALQGALKAAGYYNGPIDGQWSQELEDALKALQSDLGVEPTGQVGPETLAAFQDALQKGLIETTTTTTTTTAPEPPPTEAPTTTTTTESTTTTSTP